MSDPVIANLQALLTKQSGEDLLAAVERFKENGWTLPFWTMGSREDAGDGNVALKFALSQQEGSDRPLMTAYVDENEAKTEAAGEPLIDMTFGQLCLVAQHNAIDIAIVGTEGVLTLEHPQVLMVRDMVLMQSANKPDGQTINLFINNAAPFIKAAQSYCETRADIDSLHLAVLMAGGAALRLSGVLTARNASAHMDALRALYETHGISGHVFTLSDHLSANDLDGTILQLPPVYTRQKPSGWWARLFKPSAASPMLAVIDLNFT